LPGLYRAQTAQQNGGLKSISNAKNKNQFSLIVKPKNIYKIKKHNYDVKG
jgi:hypothetical protein